MSSPAPSLEEATATWARVGVLSFGGPAGQIAVMHRILVDEKRWVDEDRFLHALKFCTLLPGPEAQQLATYLGWCLHGTLGGLIAGSLFIIPGVVILLGLSLAYVYAADIGAIGTVFAAIRPAVLIIVVDALLRIGRRSLPDRRLILLALGAFAALFFFKVPYPFVILGSAAAGLMVSRTTQPAGATALLPRGTWRRAAVIATVGSVLWGGAVAALWLGLGGGHVITQGARLWSKAAVVTFGGAYAVLDYVRVAAVEQWHWISPRAMLDGLSLAETTPGPLILVLQFVGFQAGFQASAPLTPLGGGLLGAATAVWITFVPSFLFVLLGAPYVEWLRYQPRLAAVLTGISAAVVGVIANLSLWFALQTLFHDRTHLTAGPLAIEVPILASLDVMALGIAVAAGVAMFRFRQSMARVLVGALLVGLGAAAAGCGRPSAAARTGTIAVDHGSLGYEDQGGGPALVFIHGGNLDRRMWDGQAELFRRDHRVIRYDVRGFGQSSPAGVPHQAHRDLADLLDSLGVERAAVVGLSLGGRIAIDYALTHPGRVTHLILAGTGLSGWPDWSGSDTTWRLRMEAAVRDSNPNAIAAAWLSSDYMRPAMEVPRLVPLLERIARDNAPTWLRPDLESPLDPPAAGRLAEIHVPTLIMVGDRDSPPILRIADALATTIPGARLVRFPRTGHMVNLEQPDRFNQEVTDFLQRTR